MTKLQLLALEHVDDLLISSQNTATQMDEEKEGHNMTMRSDELAKDLQKIQAWCRAISTVK